MWSNDLEDENELVAIWRQTNNGSRVNNGDREGSYKHNKMFQLQYKWKNFSALLGSV